MGFNLLGATAGLLEAGGNLANQYAERQAEREKQQLLMQIQERKEKVDMLREEIKERYNIKKAEIAAATAEMKEDRKDERSSLLEDRRDARAEKAEEARERRALRSGGGRQPSAFSEKRAYADEMVASGEWTKEQRNKFLNAEDPDSVPKKGALTEYQQIRERDKAEEVVDEIDAGGGPDETNLNKYNRARERLGMPPVKKVVKSPGKKGGLLGFGAKEPEYEYAPDEQSEKVESVPIPEEEEAPKGKGVDKWSSLLAAPDTPKMSKPKPKDMTMNISPDFLAQMEDWELIDLKKELISQSKGEQPSEKVLNVLKTIDELLAKKTK